MRDHWASEETGTAIDTLESVGAGQMGSCPHCDSIRLHW